MTASTRKALIDQLLAEKQAIVKSTLEIFDRLTKIADQALAEGDEETRWAADAEAWRARHAYDEVSANLDRLIERLEAQGTT